MSSTEKKWEPINEEAVLPNEILLLKIVKIALTAFPIITILDRLRRPNYLLLEDTAPEKYNNHQRVDIIWLIIFNFFLKLVF